MGTGGGDRACLGTGGKTQGGDSGWYHTFGFCPLAVNSSLPSISKKNWPKVESKSNSSSQFVTASCFEGFQIPSPTFNGTGIVNIVSVWSL